MRVPLPGPVWAIICLFVVTSLAGCHGLELTDGNTTASTNTDPQQNNDALSDPPAQDDDDTEPEDEQETTPAPPPDQSNETTPTPPEFTFTISGAPGQVAANETFNVTVDVAGDDGQATTAEIAYGTTSTASVDDADLTTDMFDTTIAGDPTTLTLPGTYRVTNWSLGTPGTVYFRAHIVVDSSHYWSNEFSITVEEPPAVEEVTGTPDQIVTIGIGGANADFSPATVTISVGETVRWDNDDTLAPHTATHDVPEADRLWDTGNIAQGANSGVFQFNKAGTYAYVCLYHSGMTGSVVVE